MIVLDKLNRFVGRLAANLVLSQLRMLRADIRAYVLEQATESMVEVTPISNGQIAFYAPAALLLARARSVLSKETDTIKWIDTFNGGVFWDIGANVGVYSLYAAIQKKIKVLSFEPSAANFYVLSKNVQLNQLCEFIATYCIAFCEDTKIGVLNMSSSTMGSAVSQFGEVGEMSRYWEGNSTVSFHGMTGFSIDYFIKRFSAPFPNYLKLDVDGLELPILLGARDTLRDSRVKSVLVELNIDDNSELDNTTAFLKEVGLTLSSKGTIQGTQTGQAANYLFVRNLY